MISVALHIQYLLTRHDCVIVPRFGAFIARYTPARLSADGSMLLPPCRTVGFNPDVNHNDGMLAAGIVRREGVTYEVAAAAIDSLVAAWNSELTLHGVCTLPRIGSMTRDANGALIFAPAADGIASSAFTGLPAVALDAAVHTSALPGAAGAVPASRRRPLVRHLRRVAGVAASLAVLVVLALTLATPVLSDFGLRADYAGIGTPGSDLTPDPDVVCPALQPLPEPADAALILVRPDSLTATAPAIPCRPALARPDQTRHRCFLIVGSFDTRRKANEWIAAQHGEQLELLVSDGRVRVYAATGATIGEASALKADPEFSRRHPEAWVHVR